MHQHVAIISSPIVSSSNEHVNPVFPSTWEEAFLTTTTTLHSSHEKDRLRIGSWNANSLNPHIYEAQALGMDILAIQEARISQDVVPGIRASLGKNGYRLFHGTLPNFKLQGHNRKALHIDQTVPGVAFIVKEHIPVQEVFFEDLQHWESRGRFSALKVFINKKWVLLFNAYAPTQNSTPFLNDITHFLIKHAHTDCIFFADINACSREGDFVQEVSSIGWFPLTINTPSSFFTFKHSSGSTSCIDTIMVTEQLKEEGSPIQQRPVLKIGHVAITCTSITHKNHLGKFSIKYVMKTPPMRRNSGAMRTKTITNPLPPQVLKKIGLLGATPSKKFIMSLVIALARNLRSESGIRIEKISSLANSSRPFWRMTGLHKNASMTN